MQFFIYCVMCYNLEPSLTIIIDDGDQYSKNNNFNPKNFIVPHVEF
jgi:hypothetical protein